MRLIGPNLVSALIESAKIFHTFYHLDLKLHVSLVYLQFFPFHFVGILGFPSQLILNKLDIIMSIAKLPSFFSKEQVESINFLP